MPNDTVTLSAEEYQALIAAHAERDALRGELRLVTAERDLAEERLRAYKRELFGASSETRDADQLGLSCCSYTPSPRRLMTFDGSRFSTLSM